MKEKQTNQEKLNRTARGADSKTSEEWSNRRNTPQMADSENPNRALNTSGENHSQETNGLNQNSLGSRAEAIVTSPSNPIGKMSPDISISNEICENCGHKHQNDYRCGADISYDDGDMIFEEYCDCEKFKPKGDRT